MFCIVLKMDRIGYTYDRQNLVEIGTSMCELYWLKDLKYKLNYNNLM